MAKNFEVQILDTNTLRLVYKYEFTDLVTHLEWSPDGMFILIGVAKKAQAFVKSMVDPEWQGKIDEGLAGLANCMWAPTSRHIMTVSDFNLRLTVWSLVDKSVQFIPNPKFDGSQKNGRGIRFSPNLKMMALIEKDPQDGKDLIGLYDISQSMNATSKGPQNWVLLHRFIPETFDAQDLLFTQDGNHIVLWESPLKNSIQVYQIIFAKDQVADIQMVIQYQPYDSNRCLGIRSLMMTPDMQYILAGYCDSKLRLINTMSWKEVFAFDHAHLFDELTDNNSSPDLNIYMENETPEDGPQYEAVSKPFKLEKLSKDQMSQIQPDTNLPRVGVSKIVISPDSYFAASICETSPTCVWIWDLTKLCLNSLLVQRNRVSEICWAPTSTNLNISSMDGKIYLWSLRGASVCQVPPMQMKENFKVSGIRWNRNGKNFAAVDKGQGLVFVYPQLQFFQAEDDEQSQME